MCNIWKMEQAPDPSLQQITEFFETNRSFLRNLQFIQITGGEPFLRDDLPEIARVVHSTAPRCMMWFPTNGLLPDKISEVTKEIVDTLDAHASVFIDSQGDVYLCIVMNHKIGNINQNRLQNILSSPSSHEAREKIQKLQCPTCWLECNAYKI